MNEEKTEKIIYLNTHPLIVYLPNQVIEKLREIKENYGLAYSAIIRLIIIKTLQEKTVDEIIKELKG